MLATITRRVLRGLATLLLVATLVFVIVRITGDPIRSLLPEGTPQTIVDMYRQRWGLDEPIWQQYLLYLSGILQGDFGQSYFDSAPAAQVILDRLPATLSLALPAFLLSTVLGLTLGIAAALKRGTALDRFLTSGSVILGAVPSFIVGVLLVLIFSVTLQWLPSAGNQTLAHLLLPLLTMSITSAAVLARTTRASMSDALAMPSVEHAQALGLSRFTQVIRYALPNALLPLITVLGFDLAYIVAGSSVVEVLFSWPGLGQLFVQAAGRNDYAVVQGIVLLITASVVVFLTLTDIAYRAVDPRLRRPAK